MQVINTMTQIQFNNTLIGLQKKLHFYALSLTSDGEKANDLMQETFLKAFTFRDRFDHNTNLKAWVYTIMKNTFINDYRKKITSKITFEGSNTDFQSKFSKSDINPGPDSFYITKEIHSCIQSLEDNCKVPFTMFLDGYKYHEISRELDLPLGTVKSRIFFARNKLEKALINDPDV